MLRLFSRTLPTATSTFRSSFLPRTTYTITRNMGNGKASTDDLKSSKLFDVSPVTALVTGGGTGIGLMITQALVANGAKVYITSRRDEVLEKSAETHGQGPGQIIPLQGDVRFVFLHRFVVPPIPNKRPAIKTTSPVSTKSFPKRNPQVSNSSLTTPVLLATTPQSFPAMASQIGPTRLPFLSISSNLGQNPGPTHSKLTLPPFIT